MMAVTAAVTAVEMAVMAAVTPAAAVATAEMGVSVVVVDWMMMVGHVRDWGRHCRRVDDVEDEWTP